MLRAWSRAVRLRSYSTAAASSVNVAEKVPGSAQANAATQQTTSKQGQDLHDLLRNLGKKEATLGELEAALTSNQQLLNAGKTDPQSTARLSLLFINAGFPERAIEPWVRLLETLSSKTRTVDKVVEKPAFQPAATAALAAYVLASSKSSKDADFDPATALKLVIRTDFPVNVLGALRPYGGIKSPENREFVLDAIAKLRGYATNNYSTKEYLDQLTEANFRTVRLLWNEVERSGSADKLNEEVFAAFIRKFAETRQVDMAFKVWNKLVAVHENALSTVGWSALLRAASLATENSGQLVKGVWQQMVNAKVVPDASCYAVRISNLTRNRKYSEAIELFNELKSQPKLVDTYVVNTALVAAAEGLRDFDTANDILAYLTQHENIKPSRHTFNILIRAAQRAKKPELMRKYFGMIEKYGLTPDVVTYTHVVSELIRRGLPVDDVLAEMKASNIKPNEHMLTALAHGMSKSQQDIQYGRDIFQMMAKSPEYKLNIETFGAIIDLEMRLGGSQGVDNAVAYLGMMSARDLPPNVPTHNQVVRGAVNAKRYGVAQKLFDEMNSGKRARLAPNKYTYMFLVTGNVVSDAKAGNPAAKQLLSDALAALAHAPELLDFALAGAVERIAETMPAIVPETLVTAARETMLKDFDSRKAR